jgi:nucleoside-diphosphate-sugar epimerase
MILVTGATGFIGGHLLERLAGPVRCLVRRPSAKLPAGVERAAGDLVTGEGLTAALEGVDTVIHLAGVTKALRPADYYRGNVEATRNLLGAMAGRPARLLHVSSLAAVGPNPDAAPVAEDAVPRPITHYGKSKLEAERAVRALAPDAVIIRPPVVYGPRDSDVFQLLNSISKGLVLEIAGGERWFSAIYVEDLVEGLLAAAHAPQAAGRTYFLTHPKPSSWSELAGAAARIMGRHPRTVRVPVPLAWGVGWAGEMWARARGIPGIVSREKIREARCSRWTCDYRRAAIELGFTAETALESGLARTLAWYKEAGWLTY